MTSLGSQCEEVGGAVGKFHGRRALGLFGRDGGEGSGVDASESSSRITVKVSGAT